ncbi:MAG TPA: universal stress protein [Verrucomicrobiae bacterium]
MSEVIYDNVLHPTDCSESDASAFAHALRIALATQHQLTLLHVCKVGEKFSQEDFPHVRATLVRWLHLLPQEKQKEFDASALNICKFTKTGDDPVLGTLEHLVNHPTDLMVLATHQYEGIDRLLHRPTAEPMARFCGLKTLFVPRLGLGFVDPENGDLNLRHVLVPVDFQPDPQAALDAAAALLRLLKITDVRISILHVSSEDKEPTLTLPIDSGWKITRYRTEGNVVDGILQMAFEQHADLIAMSTEGHTGFLDALRGSMTERVVREAKCPVLAVPVGQP